MNLTTDIMETQLETKLPLPVWQALWLLWRATEADLSKNHHRGARIQARHDLDAAIEQQIRDNG